MPRTSPLVKQFLAYLEIEKGLSKNTTRSYAADLALLQKWTTANSRQLRGLTTRDIELWIGSLNKRRLNPSSVNRALSATRSFFQFLVLDGHIPSDPTIELVARTKTRLLPRFLSITEVRHLLAGAHAPTPEALRDRALLELLYGSGLRISEAVRLRLKDLSFSERLVQCLGKGNKERQVPMSNNSVASIQNYLATRSPRATAQSLLFLHQGNALTRQFAWTIIKHYAREAKLKNVAPHTLRHSFATHLLEGGASTKEVQLLLGHSHITTTEIYTHITPRYIKQAYDRYHPRAHA